MKNQKGFTLIELVVVMVILALLAAVAVPKFIELQKQAEAASVKNVLGSVRSALSLRVARALANGEDLSTLAYNGTAALNPMDDLLSNKPESYIGVVNGNQAATPNGIWYDRAQGGTDHWLMYKVKNQDIITGGWDNNGKNIIHRIETVYENGKVVGLELTPTTAYDYTWNY